MERIKPAEPVHFISRESRQRDMGKRRSRFQVFLEIEMGKEIVGKEEVTIQKTLLITTLLILALIRFIK